MRIALLTESARSTAHGAVGGWCARLVGGLPEHEFQLYLLGRSATERQPVGAHVLPLWGPRPAGRRPARLRLRQYRAAYEQLIRALVLPGERAAFGPALYRLAELSGQDSALPAFLASGSAQRTLERVWRSPAADTAAGQPLVCDVLVAGDLLEQCLRPLSAPWFTPADLGAADICHVVGGGPAVLPALIAKQRYGVPFVLTEHGLHLREQYRSYRTAPYRWPVRALLLSFFRLLTEEAYRQAALLTPGSRYDQQWQQRCGADPERIRVVYEGTPAVDREAAGPEPERPTLVWAGPLEPGQDIELLLHAFARVRAELPKARLRIHGDEHAPGYLAHCTATAERLGVAPAVAFAGRAESSAEAWESGSVIVFSALAQASPRPLADAMLSGRAVIATEVGVAREVVGPCGLLVPARRPEALAGACLALLGDAERRARLGLAGRLRAQERFAVEPAVTAFREIYLELVSRWPAFPASGGEAARPFARPAEYWVAGAVAQPEAEPVRAGESRAPGTSEARGRVESGTVEQRAVGAEAAVGAAQPSPAVAEAPTPRQALAEAV